MIYINFIVLGFVAGSAYAVLGSSLVSVYTSTGILNFAQGAMAMWPAYVYAFLRSNGTLVLPIGDIHLASQVPVVPALIIAVVCDLAIALIVHYLVFRPLRDAPVLAQVAASVGVLVTLQALVVLRFGSNTVQMQPILPSGSITVGGASLNDAALILACLAIVISTGLWAYFRFTTSGIATRAASQDEKATRLLGYSPNRLSMLMWTITSISCGVMVTFAAPPLGLNPTTFSYFVVPALAVALVGRLSSVGVTCAAGLILGSFQALITYLSSNPWWPQWAQVGLQQAVPFLIVIITMYVLGGRIPARGSQGESKLPRVTIPRIRLTSYGATALLAVVLLLVTSGNWRLGIITSMILLLLSLSVVVLTGYLGQISLAQMAFAGSAGFALSKFTYQDSWHIPFPLSIFASAIIATILGLILGLPALRIRGAQLAVITLAAAVAIENFVFNNPSLTPMEGNLIAQPELFGLNLSIRNSTTPVTVIFGIMVLIIVLIVVFFIARILRGDTGRAFLAVRSNERAAASVGINVAAAKLLGFAISAFLAGVGGALMGYSTGQLSDASFTVFTGLSLLAVSYLGGITSISGAVLAGTLGPLGVGYVFLNQTINSGNYYLLISGLALIITAILNPVGIAGALQVQLRHLRNMGQKRQPPGEVPLVEADVAKVG
jgi:branched-chain amino acid transport system permease protein